MRSDPTQLNAGRSAATIVLALAVMVATSVPAAANPFTLQKGQSDVSFTAFLWEIDEYFNGNGESRDLDFTIEQTDFLIGVDHGLTDRVTLRLSVPWSSSEREVIPGFDSGSLAVNDGVSDAQLGLVWRLNSPERRTGIALIAGLKWAGEYEIDVVNAPGDGNFDAELLFSVGRQSDRASISLDVGYRFRSGGPENEWLARVEGSWLASRRVMLVGVLDWVDSQGGLKITPTTGIFFPYSRTEEDLLRLTVGGLVSVTDRLGIFTSWASTLDGRSTARGSQWGLGTAVSF